MPTIQTIPRAAVHGYLRVLRLPLDAAERVAHRNQDTPWGPAVAYESFESKVKGVAGTVLRDDDLRDQSATQRARVDELRKAIEAHAAAQATQAVADRRLGERLETAEGRVERADRRAQAEETRIEESRAEAKEATRRRAARQKRNATRAEQARKQYAGERAKATKAETLAAEKDALVERKKATQAKAGAQEVGDAAAAARSRRRSS